MERRERMKLWSTISVVSPFRPGWSLLYWRRMGTPWSLGSLQRWFDDVNLNHLVDGCLYFTLRLLIENLFLFTFFRSFTILSISVNLSPSFLSYVPHVGYLSTISLGKQHDGGSHGDWMGHSSLLTQTADAQEDIAAWYTVDFGVLH